MIMEQIQEQVKTRAPEILVMEDETSLAKGLRMILEKEGYHVDTASTGHSAMDALKRKGFDLLVADLRLPDMDGMDIIREVRERRPETKTIVITGYPSVSSAVDAMKLGVSDYLPKPFWDDDFKQAVEKALKGGKEVHLKQEPDIAHVRSQMVPERGVADAAKQEAPGRPRVLLMEDEPSLAQGLKMVLSKQGYEVELANSGLRALASLGMKRFDILVADLRLPDMDGIDVLRTVKETRPETQVIVITGYASVPTAVDSMKLGVLDYLPKPFTMDEFVGAVEKAAKTKTEAPPVPDVSPPVTEEERLIQRREVIRVLDRTSEDSSFWRELMETHSEVLKEYRLSNEAKAAVLSGDLRWINANVGGLTQKQLMFIFKRLEREAW
jgi:DNA-binding NtrC family response regulator